MVATKSAISFGMVYIPISLQKTNRDTSISFNQLSKETNKDASKYKDEYQAKLRQAIQAKIEGQRIVNVDNEKPQTAVDLMDALSQTLAMTENNLPSTNPS